MEGGLSEENRRDKGRNERYMRYKYGLFLVLIERYLFPSAIELIENVAIIIFKYITS